MAIVTATFDTVAKTFGVTMDGTEIPNVTDFSVYCSMMDGKMDDEYMMRIGMKDEDETNDMKMYHSIVAKDSLEGKEAINRGIGVDSKLIPDYVIADNRSIIGNQISKFLGKK